MSQQIKQNILIQQRFVGLLGPIVNFGLLHGKFGGAHLTHFLPVTGTTNVEFDTH
jgi:hypothetical protein